MRLAAVLLVVAVTACGSDTGSAPSDVTDTASGSAADSADDSTDDSADIATGVGADLFPDVVDATATFDGTTWTIAATLSSPYDSPERYADAWRVVGPDGTVYGQRLLAHDHANEQPFTRSVSGIEIPDDVDAVTIEGRDQVSGWGGATFRLVLPER